MEKKSSKLILMRHGQSLWNQLNLFTGWVDISLSPKGIQESLDGGKKIAHLPIDLIYTSTLIRAQLTAMLAMSIHSSQKVPCFVHPDQDWTKMYSEAAEKNAIPVFTAWQLNERMYGKLQGLNKKETAEKFGEAQVQKWRRSFDEAPPEGESLKMTAERTIPYFEDHILPRLAEGKNVFISAHGNSLRSIVMDLDKLSPEEVISLEIGTGEAIVYTFEGNRWSRDAS